MKLLKKLTQVVSPSGNEDGIIKVIQSKIQGLVDEIYTDALGNLIAHKKGSGKRIMLAAHADEIGVMVTFIEDNGFLRIHNVGGVKPSWAVGTRVRFISGVCGVVYYDQKADAAKLSFDDLYLDIGASTKKEAEELVSIGDVAAFEGELIEQGNVVVSKALDNRVGCYCLIECIRCLKKTDNDLYFVFTAQEELGLRGAGPAAFGIEPDIAIAVDVTSTGDVIGAKTMAVKLGGGAAVKVRDDRIITHHDVRKLLVDTAIENKIPYQMEVLTFGGTDVGAIHQTKGGVKSGAV